MPQVVGRSAAAVVYQGKNSPAPDFLREGGKGLRAKETKYEISEEGRARMRIRN